MRNCSANYISTDEKRENFLKKLLIQILEHCFAI